jgi:hypothetical protein
MSNILGCTSLTTTSTTAVPSIPSLEKLFEKEEPIVEPKGVAVVWTNAVFEKEGSRSTRGFGGMVTFYGEDRKKPVRVDGGLTIYAYENMARDEEDPIPDRKYVFKPEQLAKHYDQGTLGPSYSIWIPWDAVGGPRKEIGLIARFDSVAGTTVMGRPTHNVLEGPARRRTLQETSAGKPSDRVTPFPSIEKARPFGVKESGESESAGPRMKTVTLTVPSRAGQSVIHEENPD